MCASRAGKVSHLTRRMKILNTLMADNESVDEVKQNMARFHEMLQEFEGLHSAYIQTLSKEAKEADMQNWYEPRMKQINSFLSNAAKWISAADNPEAHSTAHSLLSAGPLSSEANADLPDIDALSVSSRRSSTSIRSNVSSSALICAEAERAALLAKAAALQEKHALEKEQELVEQKKEELRKRRETLELNTELAANKAKIDILKNAEQTAFENYNEEEQLDPVCNE